MSCVLLGEQDWPNTEHAVREVMAMEFLFQNHPKSIQKQSESTSENLKFPQKSTKICKVRNLASYDMCHGPHRTDEKGIATRLAYLLRFSMAEKVITAIAIPSRELKSRKTQFIYQSQWSNPAHKQTFPSRLQWLQLIMVLNPCKVKLGRLTMTCSSGLPSTKTWQKRPKDWQMTPTCNTQRYSFGCTAKT